MDAWHSAFVLVRRELMRKSRSRLQSFTGPLTLLYQLISASCALKYQLPDHCVLIRYPKPPPLYGRNGQAYRLPRNGARPDRDAASSQLVANGRHACCRRAITANRREAETLDSRPRGSPRPWADVLRPF